MKIDREKLVRLIEERGDAINPYEKSYTIGAVTFSLESNGVYAYRGKGTGEKCFGFFDQEQAFIIETDWFYMTYKSACDLKSAFEAVHKACQELGVAK